MNKNTIKISDDVVASIRRCQLNGNTLVMPDPSTEKFDNWPQMKKVFDAMGGKWNSKQKAVVFPSDAAMLLLPAVEAGEAFHPKKAFQFFETPRGVADFLVKRATGDWDGTPMRVLEPSAGNGALVEAMCRAWSEYGLHIHVCEIQETCRAMLTGKGYRLIGDDFLKVGPDPVYDRIVMNPPFQNGQDAKHVSHAFEFLKPGGRLISVMSAAVGTNQNNTYRSFRTLLATVGGRFESLPDHAFRESGTNVSTVYVVMDKPSREPSPLSPQEAK